MPRNLIRYQRTGSLTTIRYSTRGMPMSSTNQSPSVVNGIIPKATVPSVPHQATEANTMRNELRIIGLWAAILLAVSAFGQTAPKAVTPVVPILQEAALPMYLQSPGPPM